MAKSVIILALSVLSAHGAVLRHDDAVLNRAERSPCGSCQNIEHGPPPPPFAPPAPPPPPPPPPFVTRNWSGYARHGNQHAVFSGAEAAASDGGAQASGQAFSVAGNSDTQQASKGNEDFKYTSYQEQQHNGNHLLNQQQHGQHQNQNFQGGNGNQNPGFNSASQASASANSFAGDSQNGGSNGFERRGDNNEFGHENQGQSSANSYASSQYHGSQQGSQHFEASNYQKSHGFESKNEGHEQQEQSHNGFSSHGGSGQNGGGQNGGNQYETEDAQSSLHGALNLASQGLQAAHNTQAGCSTCGKSNYALSNAKSNSGSAVAVSIGG